MKKSYSVFSLLAHCKLLSLAFTSILLVTSCTYDELCRSLPLNRLDITNADSTTDSFVVIYQYTRDVSETKFVDSSAYLAIQFKTNNEKRYGYVDSYTFSPANDDEKKYEYQIRILPSNKTYVINNITYGQQTYKYSVGSAGKHQDCTRSITYDIDGVQKNGNLTYYAAIVIDK